MVTLRKKSHYSLISSLLFLCCLLIISPRTLTSSDSSASLLANARRISDYSVNQNMQDQHKTVGSSSKDQPHDYVLPSLKASIAEPKLTQFKDVYFDFILYSILETNFTQLDFGHNKGFMKDNLFTLFSRGEDAIFELIEQDNSFKIRATGIKAELTSEYTRVREFLVTASGHVHVVCQNITVEIQMNMNTMPSNDTDKTGRLLWGMQTVSVLVEADTSQVELTLEGNIFADFLNIFHSMYLPMVISVTEDTMMLSLKDQLPDMLNAYPQGIDGYIQAFDQSMPKFLNLILDLDTSEPIKITNDYIGLTGRGLWFHELQGRRNISYVQDIDLPYNDPDVLKPLQVFLGKYFFESVFESYIDANPGWGINITNYELGNNSIVVLNTHFMNVYFPGIRQHFDGLQKEIDPLAPLEGKEIRAYFELLNARNWDSNVNNQSMTVEIDWMLHFNVSMDNETLGHNEVVALQVLLQNMTVEFVLEVFQPMTIRVSVKRLSIGSFTTVYSAFGPVNDRLYNLAINQLFFPETGMVKMFNWDVLWMIPLSIPSVVIDMVQLSDIEFYYYDHYVMFGTGLNWLPWDLPFTLPV